MKYILAIESSCDDTSAAVLADGKILSNLTANQTIHQRFGGVVPELASRDHEKNIVPVVHEALKAAGVDKRQLNAIAFTRGPGLIGSLLVGTSFAKSMALTLNVPIIEVNHMQAHVLAHFIDDPKPAMPFICLTVSGGHTQLVLTSLADADTNVATTETDRKIQMKIIGETFDGAAGEAFDKTAKILGLPYPGGPLIDQYAREGNPLAFNFPHPKIDGLNFSFSGLKTAILYFVRDHIKHDPDFVKKNLNDICASVQHTIVTILLTKLKKAAEEFQINEIAIAGGVSANSGLRKAFVEMGKKENWNTYIPDFQYCTDNAAMIAIAAWFKYLNKDFATQDITPLARYSL